MEKRFSVWVLDPANLTPFYSHALSGSLADAGIDVRFVTSEFHYDAGSTSPPSTFPIDIDYFKRFKALQTRCGSMIRKLTRAAFYPFGHWQFLRRVRAEKPAVVHLQWSRLPGFDLKLIQKLQAAGVRVVHTVHDVEPLYRGSGGRSALGKVYATCDALIVHTHANATELIARYPRISKEKIHVIPHGPLQAETKPADATRASARKALGIADDVPVALFFGTIKRYKGLDILIDALPTVIAKFPKCCLLIAGKPGGPADVPDLSPLKRLGADIRTEFGFIANADVWKYYLACDVVVLPYRNITQSGVLLSALAFGRPAIVTRVGGLPEIVEAGQVGWVTPVENSSAVAEALIDAFANLPRTHAMGERAAIVVERDYAWSTIGRTTRALYERLLQG